MLSKKQCQNQKTNKHSRPNSVLLKRMYRRELILNDNPKKRI